MKVAIFGSRVSKLKIAETVVNQLSHYVILMRVFGESFTKLVAKGIVMSSNTISSLTLTGYTVVTLSR